MSYMLRVVIFESFWERQLADIIEVCRKARIEEVLFLEQSHQIAMVPYPLEKHRRMADIYKKMAGTLRSHGIVYSINLATLIGHSDARVEDEWVLPFQKFVGDDLREAHANYCILDEGWQDYAAQVCSIYGSTQPDKMYIDDDFRSLNHTTLLGCFCPIHAARTAKACSMELTPQSLFDHIRGSEEIDYYVREAWIRVNFDSQLEAARRMRLAAEEVSPLTRLGLMNSGEPSHSVQGRDMDLLLREFSGSTRRPLSRPAGGYYSDMIHGQMFESHQWMALSIHQIGNDVQITSEVENWPHTRFTKSVHCTRMQMELHALAGAEDFTLNVYDYLATPYEQESGFTEMLRSMKDKLSIIQRARKGKQAVGFGLPWHRNTAAKSAGTRGYIADLMPNREIDHLLAQFGLPTQFTPARGNALLGDAVQAYDDHEIRTFLSGGLLIDGTALDHLCARGFGQLLGCRTIGMLPHAAVERLDPNEFSGAFAGNNLLTNWFNLDKEGKYVYQLELSEGARAISTLLDCELHEVAPGTVVYENELGGRIAVFPVPITTSTWKFRSRAYQVGKVAGWLMFDELPLWIEDSPNVGPFYYVDPLTGEGLLGIVSGSLDWADLKLHSSLDISDLFADETGAGDLQISPLSIRLFSTRKGKRLRRP